MKTLFTTIALVLFAASAFALPDTCNYPRQTKQWNELNVQLIRQTDKTFAIARQISDLTEEHLASRIGDSEFAYKMTQLKAQLKQERSAVSELMQTIVDLESTYNYFRDPFEMIEGCRQR